LGLPDPELFVWIRIWIQLRILPSTSKKFRKTLISIVFGLLNEWLYLKIDVNIPTVKSRLGSMSVIQCTEKHPDPSQNVTDLEHWF
jgi:hypothetical protein